MRVFLSCLVCRIVTFVLHKLGRGATSMPGKVALKVKRNVLKDLSERLFRGAGRSPDGGLRL